MEEDGEAAFNGLEDDDDEEEEEEGAGVIIPFVLTLFFKCIFESALILILHLDKMVDPQNK